MNYSGNNRFLLPNNRPSAPFLRLSCAAATNAWLLAFVVLPAKSDTAVRLGVVIYLALLSVWVQPTEVWKDQLGRVTLLSGILFVLLGLSTDSTPSLLRSRSPPSSVMGLPNLAASFEGYKYVILKFRPLQLTNKGLLAATTAACLMILPYCYLDLLKWIDNSSNVIDA